MIDGKTNGVCHGRSVDHVEWKCYNDMMQLIWLPRAFKKAFCNQIVYTCWLFFYVTEQILSSLGKWDNKKKNKSFWQNFRKSQHKPVTRQSSKGLCDSCFSSLTLQTFVASCLLVFALYCNQERTSATWPARSPWAMKSGSSWWWWSKRRWSL